MSEARCKAMTMDERKAFVAKLIEQFRENEKFYLTKDFVESECRSKFIDPLLECLGWDVKNEKGARHDRQEVITEDRVVIDGQKKHPDYTLCYGGERKIYVEAKQPSVDLKTSPEPALQVRRYAYTSKMPIAILTDFQELAIYDTRIKPKANDTAATARIDYLTYDKFEERFEELYNRISWQAVDLGKFDTYWETSRDKKGTASVDNDILQMIEDWRVMLAEDIALHNEEIDEFNLTSSVQKIIDRILFLRICEDKEIEERAALKKIADSKTDIYKNLKTLFSEANQKFNAGLFATDQYLDGLNVQDKTLASIINALYFPECQYEFSVLPVEILGSIYERFLGKIIRFARKTKNGHSVEIVEKPEVQKAGGVYYTPPYIVRYIVEQTIGKKIQGKTPEQVCKMRFVDPACGSGSFLVGAYQHLLDWHLTYYLESAEKYEKAGKIYKDSVTRNYKLSIEEKRAILLNNIYGVDIDAQAVEVTKLSLFLKLLENEGRSLSKSGQAQLFRSSDLRSKILPSMTDNIKCGNSLIASDYYAQKDLDGLGLAEQRKVNAFDWQKQFAVVFEQGGFDCVIGNPPYVSVELMSDGDKEYYKTRYEAFVKRCDLFGVFLNQAVKRLVANNGYVSFIVPSVVHTNISYQKIRDILLENKWLAEVCYTGGKVFSGVTVDTTILVCKKSAQTEIILKDATDFENPKTRVVASDYFAAEKNIISIGNDEGSSIFEKLFAKDLKPIGDDYTIYQGIVTGNNTAFIFETQEEALKKGIEKELLHPLCHGRDIGRYETRSLERRILYVDENTDLKKYPGAKEWLLQFKAALEKRNKEKTTDSIAWNRLHRPRVQSELDIKEKILVQRTRNESLKVRVCATLDSTGVYGSEGIYFLIPKTKNASLRFLLAVLNSSVINYLFATKFLNLAIKAEYLKQVKLPFASADKQAALAKLAGQMIEAKQKLFAAKSESDKKFLEQRVQLIDAQINSAVYKLYGLSDDEIKVVEGK